ncbi:MAG: hypothetical protein H6R26_2319 [Proteobacteria bacterium]|nr:hypothetical protein [Pseudomonadota bacterium]
MATPWIRGVQQTGQLTVFPGPGLLRAAAWGDALFNRILDEFNRLATVNRFGVRLVRNGNAPDPNGGGANVQVEVSNGTHTFFDTSGNPTSGTLNVSPGQMHGITHGLTFSSGASPKLARAFVFVPANPVLGAGQRGLGIGPKMGLTLHELLHACGLSSSDPGHTSSLSAGDIYMTGAIVDAGVTPDRDQFLFGSRREPNAAGQFTLNASTVQVVQSVWLFGQF